MSLCQLERINDQHARCPECGRTIHLPNGMEPADVLLECGREPRVATCQHLGERTGRLHLVTLGARIERNREHHCNHPKSPARCVPYHSVDDGVAVCARCPLYEPLEPEPHYDVPADVAEVQAALGGKTQAPTMREQAANYTKATAKWVAAGRPVRSEEEIGRIIEICEACPNYDQRRKRCKLCGCNVNRSRRAMWNKIAMATEKCPDKPPRWE